MILFVTFFGLGRIKYAPGSITSFIVTLFFYFLITRNLLPVATILSVIYANIKLNFIESSMNGKHLESLT